MPGEPGRHPDAPKQSFTATWRRAVEGRSQGSLVASRRRFGDRPPCFVVWLFHARFAGVLASHQRQVVLVREEYPSWGGAYWNMPSGRVEEHESPAEGARRELAEETGLVVPLAGLVLQGTSATASPNQVSRAWNFTIEVHDPALRVSDPDGLIQDVRWFSAEEAVRLLRDLPYRPLFEPAVAVLTGQVSVGAHWAYPDPTAEPTITVQER